MASGKFAGKIGHHLLGASVCMQINLRAGTIELISFEHDLIVPYKDVTVKENDGQPSNNLLMVTAKSANIKG